MWRKYGVFVYLSVLRSGWALLNTVTFLAYINHKRAQFLQDRETKVLGWMRCQGSLDVTKSKSFTCDNLDVRSPVKSYTDICVPQPNFTSLSTDVPIHLNVSSVRSLFLDPFILIFLTQPEQTGR